MTARFLPWLKSCRGAQTGLWLLVVGILLATGPHFAVAVDTEVRLSGDVDINGSVSAPTPTIFTARDELLLTVLSNPSSYDNFLLVLDSLGTLEADHVAARVNFFIQNTPQVHFLSAEVKIENSPDPVFDVAHAHAGVRLLQQITMDQDYRWAMTWNRGSATAHDHPNTNVVLEDHSLFMVHNTQLNQQTGYSSLHTNTFVRRDSDVVAAGDVITMTSSLDLTGDAYPPFWKWVWDDMNLRLLPSSAGLDQQSALQPDTGRPFTVFDATVPGVVARGTEWVFDNYPSGLWFDPPTTSELAFEMISETLFDKILDFPAGLDMPVTVSAEGQVLGAFSPGDELDFVALLGHGVSSFKVSGISPPAMTGDTPSFSLQLAFNEQTADFQIRAYEAVPEPSSLMLCCAAALLVAFRGLPWAAGRRWRAPNSARR